jgi:hypothetical protein
MSSILEQPHIGYHSLSDSIKEHLLKMVLYVVASLQLNSKLASHEGDTYGHIKPHKTVIQITDWYDTWQTSI